MSFRWKKTRGSSRFSQLVTDHLQSPKHVVETGFPTSLVDLFVKNRNRIRKSSKKNRSPNPATAAAAVDVLDPILPTSSPPLNQPNLQSEPISPKGYASNCQIADEIDERGNLVPVLSRTAGGGAAKTGFVGLLMWVLKFFLVVCLALGTKKFVIGITLSAFVLFFLELIGKKLRILYSPSSDSTCKFEPVGASLDGGGISGENDFSDCSDSTGEIQIVRFQSCPEQILSSEVSSKDADFDTRVLCKEDLYLKTAGSVNEASFGVAELKHQYSRRARMKSKMKKLVPKNLRKSKKTYSSLESDGSGSLQSDTWEEQEQCNNMVLDCQDEEDEQEQCNNNIVLDSSLGEVEERPTKGGSGYLGLCLIVLFGLVGGRTVALVLALSWCMVLKILAWWRSHKVPLLR